MSGALTVRRPLPALPGRWRSPGSVRVLVAASLLGSIGFGLYQAGSLVYFVHSVGLPPTLVGAGLSAAALAGLLLGIPIGRWADRYDPRAVAIAAAVAKALVSACLPWVDAAGPYLMAVLLLGVADAGWNVANEAVIAGTANGADRVRISAYLRSAFNAGVAVGAFGAGLALAVDSPVAYLVLFGGQVGTAAAVAGLYLLLPRVSAAQGHRATERPPVERAWPYLVVAQLSGLTLLSDTILAVGLPVWITTRTAAPQALAAWLIGLNTLLVIGLQVRAARRAETLAGATLAQRRSFAALAGACVLACAALWGSAWLASIVLVAVVVALTAGELWGQGARWTLRFTLAPDTGQGRYGGIFRLGLVAPRVAGPLLVTALLGSWPVGGWLFLAALFTGALAVSRTTVGWAARRAGTGVERPPS